MMRGTDSWYISFTVWKQINFGCKSGETLLKKGGTKEREKVWKEKGKQGSLLSTYFMVLILGSNYS